MRVNGMHRISTRLHLIYKVVTVNSSQVGGWAASVGGVETLGCAHDTSSNSLKMSVSVYRTPRFNTSILMSTKFLFEKIPPGCIRLFELQPGDRNTPLHGRLRTVLLQDGPPFEALSYTWGSLTASSTLFSDECPLPLTENLAQALLRLRYVDKTRTLWIDQICINQQDGAEQAQQVSIMGQIYRAAEVVNIWLGEENEDTELAWDQIQAFQRTFRDPEEVDDDGNPIPHVITTLGILSLRSPRWMALTDMFKRSYFRRMWIVQEVVLGSKCIVHCGSFVTSWEILARSSLCLGADEVQQAEAHYTVRMISGLKRQLANHKPRLLVTILDNTFNLQCTDPKDKIYGILGLVTDLNQGELSPDYSLSHEGIYHQITRFCIEKYHSPTILCNVRHPKNFINLPSWVPDWTATTNIQKSLGHKDAERYSATADQTAIFHFADETRTLCVQGQRIDRIQNLGSIMPSTENGNSILEWKDFISPALPYFTEEAPRTVLWRLLLADGNTRGPASDRARNRLYDAHENLIVRNGLPKGAPWEPIDEMSIVNTSSLQFTALALTASLGRRVAITKKGYIGLVPPDAQVGDEICALYGAPVLFVLRAIPTESDCHLLVGESYLQGWMDGTLLRGTKVEFRIR